MKVGYLGLFLRVQKIILHKIVYLGCRLKTKRINIVKALALGFTVCLFPPILDITIWQERAYAEGPKRGVVERQYAILKLTDTQDPSVPKLILHGLKDPDPLVRYAAAWRIGRLHATHLNEGINAISSLDVSQSPEIIQALISGLSDQDPWVRVQLIKTLSEIAIKRSDDILLGQKIKQSLLVQLSDPDPYIRSVAIRALGSWRADVEVNTTLRRAFHDEASMVRDAIFWVRDGDFEALAETTYDESPEIRVMAVGFLSAWHLNNPRTVDLLIERLWDPDDRVVIRAIAGVQRSGNPKVVKPLLDFLMAKKSIKEDDQDNTLEQQVQAVIEEITGKTLDEALRNYSPPQPPPKREASVRQIDVRKQIDKLDRGAEPDRLSAVIALTWSEAPEAVEVLVRALEDPAPRVRYAAADALGENHSSQTRRTDRVVSALLKATDDSHPHVRRSVVAGLGRLSYKKEFLSRVISQLSDLASRETDPFVRLEIVSALRPWATNLSESPSELIEKKKAGAILIGFVHDEFPAIRSWAIGAVDLSCYPEIVGRMFSFLNDPVASIRLNAIKNLSDNADILNRVDQERLRKKLTEVTKNDPSEDVREAATRGLETAAHRLFRPKPNLLKDQSLAGCRGAADLN